MLKNQIRLLFSNFSAMSNEEKIRFFQEVSLERSFSQKVRVAASQEAQALIDSRKKGIHHE